MMRSFENTTKVLEGENSGFHQNHEFVHDLRDSWVVAGSEK